MSVVTVGIKKKRMDRASGGAGRRASKKAEREVKGQRPARWTRRGERHGPPVVFFFQAEDRIRDYRVTGVQTCALPIWKSTRLNSSHTRLSCDWSSDVCSS